MSSDCRLGYIIRGAVRLTGGRVAADLMASGVTKHLYVKALNRVVSVQTP